MPPELGLGMQMLDRTGICGCWLGCSRHGHPRAKPSTRGLLGLIGVPPPCSPHRTHLLGWRWPVLRPAQELGTAICRAGLATTLCRAGLGSADVDPTPWGDGSQCLLSGSPPQSLRMLMEGGGGECKSLCLSAPSRSRWYRRYCWQPLFSLFSSSFSKHGAGCCISAWPQLWVCSRGAECGKWI